ncbi:peptide chain release factor 1 [Wolbachia endosymbiont of Howardula sp.]|uniref:peptide chain release factor 1 n=1 Tax=Wolbachia endosymbiont of Howardula sp. TaxID=2916816 RepID=UPI00217E156E|nr:peptide chain release factor 1 [Wolbachia endosymbiont of Howardula sp.]UWI83237.1 peptide chain release factor 1 [Wolbachia endosymbiont of Howardula sp.]
MDIENHLRDLKKKFYDIQNDLEHSTTLNHKEFIHLSKIVAELTPIINRINEYQLLQEHIVDLTALIRDHNTEDNIKELAKEELYEKQKVLLPQVKSHLERALLPKDQDDTKNAILEIRAGTGGVEASLFVTILLRMYQKYAEIRKWTFELINITHTGIGGYKEVSALINGTEVFARLKFESGVHRIQRVPETESSGRLHTSTATVAILPSVEEFDFKIAEKDLRIDVYKSSGPGGQSVNTTDSAVRITHIPTGTVVVQQDEKSQHKNKAKALKVLRSRLYEIERQKKIIARATMRKHQIGSGDRSERIRTYNFPQSRVTDHRISLTSHRLEQIVKGGELDEFIELLISDSEISLMVGDIV